MTTKVVLTAIYTLGPDEEPESISHLALLLRNAFPDAVAFMQTDVQMAKSQISVVVANVEEDDKVLVWPAPITLF